MGKKEKTELVEQPTSPNSGKKNGGSRTVLIVSTLVVVVAVILAWPTDEEGCPFLQGNSSGVNPLHAFQSRGTDCEVGGWLSPSHDAKGFHVLCVAEIDNPDYSGISIKAFVNGRNKTDTNLQYDTMNDYSYFRLHAEKHLNIEATDREKHRLRQPWAIYTPEGRRLNDIDEILKSGVVFIFEGGQWIWPGVEVGHVQTIRNIPGLDEAHLKTVSLVPLVFEVENFLLDTEMEFVIQSSEPHMKGSVVTLMDHQRKAGKSAVSNDWRTSSTFWMKIEKYPHLQTLENRVEGITRVARNHQEDLQVLRYNPGEKYDSHHDYFNPKMYKDIDWIDEGYKNRLMTVFWYLTDVPKGGETVFPRYGGEPTPKSFKDCHNGLRVKPEKGKVIIFYSMLPSGELDEYSLHGGCPVEEGVKWAANKWIWNKKFVRIPRSKA